MIETMQQDTCLCQLILTTDMEYKPFGTKNTSIKKIQSTMPAQAVLLILQSQLLQRMVGVETSTFQTMAVLPGREQLIAMVVTTLKLISCGLMVIGVMLEKVASVKNATWKPQNGELEL